MNHSFAAHKPGASFKGAMAYYLHDRPEPGTDRHVDTTERVAWTATRNLATDRPEIATAVMIATAKDADRLKEQAGVKATGRKAKAPVKTFALSWHPDEAAKLDRAEMERAADGALKAIGMERHQAVIVCHRDTKHPHVHIMVNRVNPEDGRLAPCGPKENRALDRWSYEYERDRGQIVSPNRAAKHERLDGLRDRYSENERKAYVETKKRAGAESAAKRREAVREASTLPEAQKAVERATQQRHSPAQVLRDLSKSQKERHAQEWSALSQRYSTGKDNIRAEWREKFRQVRKEYDAENKGKWREFGRQQWRAQRDRERMERSFRGCLALSITAAREQRRELAKDGRQVNFVSLVWANMRNPELRDTSFAKAKAQDKATFRRWYEGPMQSKIDRLKEGRKQHYSEHLAQFQKDRDALISRQGFERQQIKEAWKHVPQQQLERGQVEAHQPVQAKERTGFFARLDREKDQGNHRGQQSYFENRERLDREQRERGTRPRQQDRNRDWDR